MKDNELNQGKKKHSEINQLNKNDNEKENNLEDENNYYDLIKEAVTDYQSIHNFEGSQERKIIKEAKFQAKITTIISILAIILLLAPTLTLGSYIYYAGKGNKIIDSVQKIIYVTEPNTKIDGQGIDERIGLFTMDTVFQTIKRVGKQDIRTGEYDIHFVFDKVSSVKHSNLQETLVSEVIDSAESSGFLYPDEPMSFENPKDLEVLNGIGSGTVAEIYVSFNKLYRPEELTSIFPNVDILWVAVDTGPSQKDDEGVYTPPIGYPFQRDKDPRSPFFIPPNSPKTNEEVFKNILEQLAEDEQAATKVSRAKSLSLSKRLPYVEKHGIKVYGMVVTGPADELKNIANKSMIRTLKVEDSRIWNWHS